jgi:hypothetical protein
LRLGLRFDLARGAAWRSGLGSGLGDRSLKLGRLSAGGSLWIALDRLSVSGLASLGSLREVGSGLARAIEVGSLVKPANLQVRSLGRLSVGARHPPTIAAQRTRLAAPITKPATNRAIQTNNTGSVRVMLAAPRSPYASLDFNPQRHFRLPDIRLNPRRSLFDRLSAGRSSITCKFDRSSKRGRREGREGSKRQTCVCLVLLPFVRSRSARAKPSEFCPRPLVSPNKTLSSAANKHRSTSSDRVRRSEPARWCQPASGL